MYRACMAALLAIGLLTFSPARAATAADEIKLTFLGTGAPRPSHDRYGPSILVEAGDYKLLVDAGPGMRERLFQAGGFELLPSLGGPFDALLANLYADLIVGHARELAAALRPGGRFALSGCKRERRGRVLEALAAAGLEVAQRVTRGAWDAFEGRRA